MDGSLGDTASPLHATHATPMQTTVVPGQRQVGHGLILGAVLLVFTYGFYALELLFKWTVIASSLDMSISLLISD